MSRTGRRMGGPARAGLALLGVGAVSAALVTGCGGGASAGAATGATAPSAAAAPFTPTECGTYTGRGCAPQERRVDLVKPTFSDPTRITHPLFPISALSSVVLLGQVEGEPFRSETTLLPGTRTVDWDGAQVETLVSQYTAYRGGRIEEVALDRYAQADDGSVWYFGEDVVDYRDGEVATTEGTWLAGVEGPPAMIMPAAPKVGDVFRPENILGIVFEEVVVTKVDATVPTAAGSIPGALTARELHLDRTTSDKTFAPGYGEYATGKGADLEKLAVAVPADALAGPPVAELETFETAATGMLGSVRADDWEAATATLRRMRRDWAVVGRQKPPAAVADRIDAALSDLRRAIDRRRARPAQQAAIDLGMSILDLKLRHRPVGEIDRARFELWTQQALVDAAAGDRAAVSGDIATLEWIRDRITDTLTPDALAELDRRLAAARAAADDGRADAAADHAVRLGHRLRSL